MATSVRLSLVALLVSLAGLSAGAGPPEAPGDYIVVLHGHTADPGAVAREHQTRHGVTAPSFVYTQTIKGYAAKIPSQKLESLRTDPRVKYVEADGPIGPMAQALPWGIDRIDADLSSIKAGDGVGAVSGVNAYVIDSGIAAHPDLNVVGHVNFTGDGKNTDCHGHGTHVAGTIAARDNGSDVVGVVPGAPLRGVKVLGCKATGTISALIAGVDWVRTNAVRPAIANISVGGAASTALDTAVKNLADAGIAVIVAAGNSGTNACNVSPARAGLHSGVITTAAIDANGNEPAFSNYGYCVDIWGPGTSILSTARNGGTTTLSGTSQAAPHVAGTSALWLTANPAATAASAELALKASAIATAKLSKDGRPITLVYAGAY